MNRLLLSRTVVAAGRWQNMLKISRQISLQTPNLRSVESVDDYVEKELQKEAPRVPLRLQPLVEAFRRRFSKKETLDPEFKSLLDKAAAQLYFDCANKYPYLTLCETFGLPDYMSTWFKLTLMHVWMVLLRVHVSMDAASYERIKSTMLSTMWMDIDKRLEVVGEEVKQKLNLASDLKNMNGLYLQTLLEYDEGFIQDDPALAAAVWRNLYMQRSFDPIYVSRVVRYMRATVAFLDSVPTSDVVASGVPIWKPGDALRQSLNKMKRAKLGPNDPGYDSFEDEEIDNAFALSQMRLSQMPAATSRSSAFAVPSQYYGPPPSKKAAPKSKPTFAEPRLPLHPKPQNLQAGLPPPAPRQTTTTETQTAIGQLANPPSKYRRFGASFEAVWNEKKFMKPGVGLDTCFEDHFRVYGITKTAENLTGKNKT